VLGGAVEKVHLLLAGAYQAAGHDVTIISRKYKNFPDEERVDGIRHLRIASYERSSSLAVNLALDFVYALRVARSLPQSDVTITNSFFLPLLVRHKTAGKIYVHVARFPKHQMLLYWRTDRLQAISRAVAEEIVRQAPSLGRKVVTIAYPVADDYFSSKPLRPRKKVVLYVGRIAREKGVRLLIESFAAMLKYCDPADTSEWKLRIVGPHDIAHGGDGPEYLRELLDLAQPLGFSCVFAGPIFDKEELIKEYQAASVFVYPSLAESGEAFGLAPLEAMAAGCAVVVSNLHCFDDFVEDGLTALKFEHRCSDPRASLTAKLALLIKQPKLIEEFGKHGNMAARKFQASAVANRMLDDFGSLLKH
jgi:glycosyltransferase involved in cell wall biosynthesis